MHRYRADHTGPKSQFGGFQLGFARVAYQPGIFGVVTAPPIPAIARQRARKTTRPIQGCFGGEGGIVRSLETGATYYPFFPTIVTIGKAK
jgi:hypothetical protein